MAMCNAHALHRHAGSSHKHTCCPSLPSNTMQVAMTVKLIMVFDNPPQVAGCPLQEGPPPRLVLDAVAVQRPQQGPHMVDLLSVPGPGGVGWQGLPHLSCGSSTRRDLWLQGRPLAAASRRLLCSWSCLCPSPRRYMLVGCSCTTGSGAMRVGPAGHAGGAIQQQLQKGLCPACLAHNSRSVLLGAMHCTQKDVMLTCMACRLAA